VAIGSHQNRDRVRTVSFYAVLALVTYLLYIIARPFIVPLCAAAVFVIFFYPVHEWLERRVNASVAALLSTFLVTAMLIVPLILVSIAFVREATAAVAAIQAALTPERFAQVGSWWYWLEYHLPLDLDLGGLAADGGKALAGFTANLARNLLVDVGVFLFHVVVVIFSMFFFFRDARPMMAIVRRVLPFEDRPREHVINQAHELIRASVVTSFVVAIAQGTAGGLIFFILGFSAPVFWGVVMAFFSLLPLIGAWAVWLPAAIWLIAEGHVGQGLVLLGLGAGVVSSIDNVLRPMLLAGRAQLNGLLVLVSVLGGIAAFGPIGLVLGPVIVATMSSLLSAYTLPPPFTTTDEPVEEVRV
jgi:predicted PurR-regulated permease PerM